MAACDMSGIEPFPSDDEEPDLQEDAGEEDARDEAQASARMYNMGLFLAANRKVKPAEDNELEVSRNEGENGDRGGRKSWYERPELLVKYPLKNCRTYEGFQASDLTGKLFYSQNSKV
jgi:hypothetical protein